MRPRQMDPAKSRLFFYFRWRKTTMVTFYRRLPKFDYIKPKSLNEALSLLKEGGAAGVIVYAGGTDVIPKLKSRLLPVPDILLDLKGIPGLEDITYSSENGLRIGALASIFAVAESKTVQEHYPILVQAAKSIASVQVQNRGTLVGNVCSAVPSADSTPALLCLGAQLICTSAAGERTVGLDQFFKAPNLTDLRRDEIVKAIRIPPMRPGSRGTYLKFSPRSKMDCALVGVGVVIATHEGAFGKVRIGLGAVAPTPLRALRAERLLTGKPVSEEQVGEAAKIAAADSLPIDDHRASAQYRRTMVEVLVKRAIRLALADRK